MSENGILHVQTLGKLKITCGDASFPSERQRSVQVELLIVYLILNRNMNLTTSQLIDFLWQDGKSDHPEGALRNLVYRARKEMKRLLNDTESIRSQERGYYWNLNIDLDVDYEEIIKVAQRVKQENDLLRKYEKCLTLLSCYENGFLPEFNYNDWIMKMNNALEAVCLESILDTLQVLEDNEKYQEILTITNHTNIQNLLDSRLYEMKLYAYYKLNQHDTALDFYRQTVDYYYSRYGMTVSQKLKDIYQMILDSAPTTYEDVNELTEDLMNDGNIENAFYCDFDVFKNIFQVNVRSARRSMKARILALLVLQDTSGTLSEKQVQEEAKILRNVIAASLRKNDVFSKFNMTQFSLIIASPDFHGAEIAVKRICKNYEGKKKHPQINLSYQLKKIN